MSTVHWIRCKLMAAIDLNVTLTPTSISSSNACLILKSGAGAQQLKGNTSKERFKITCPKTTAVSYVTSLRLSQKKGYNKL